MPPPPGRQLPYGGTIDRFPSTPVVSEHPIVLSTPRFRVRPFTLLFMERHTEFSQTYVPVTGQPYVWILARKDAELVDGFPALHELQAFVNPGDIAVKMHPGTWHEAPMPFRDGLRFVILSQEHLASTVYQGRDERGEIHGLPWAERVSIERLGIDVRVALP
jgi:ureidoglycolate lyase